jgi:fucose permease
MNSQKGIEIKSILSRRFLLNISFFYTMFVLGVSYTITSPVLIELSKTTNTSIETAGYVFSFYFVGFILGCYLSIWLVTHIKRKNLLLVSYILFFATVFSLRFSSSFILISILFMLMGLAWGFIESQISILLLELNKGSEGLFINLNNAVFGIGAFLGPLVTVYIIDLGIYWQNTYLVAGILSFINILLFMLLDISKYESPRSKMSPNIFKSVKLERKTIFSLLILALFFYVCAELALTGWIPTFLRIERSFSEFSAGQIISFFWLAMIIGRIITGFLSKKFSILNILITVTVLSMASMVFGIYSTNALWIFTFIILAGLFAAALWPLLIAEGGILFHENRNSVVSLVGLLGGSGGLFIPFLLGLVYNRFGLLIAMNLTYIFMFLLVICLLALFFSIRRKKKSM